MLHQFIDRLARRGLACMTTKLRGVLALALLGTWAFAGQAHASLTICNDTAQVQSVSIGYKGPEQWTSEGWWVLQPSACATPIGGNIPNRYYYVRAEVDGGTFQGHNFYFCTQSAAYTIYGDTNCAERGYDREDFYEIDTGSNTTDYTFRLTAQNTIQGTLSTIGNTESGLKFCNETEQTQSVSVGYEGDQHWTSEGWWVMEPGECALTVTGPLKDQYFYRAEVNGGNFQGESYYFCTTPSAYTILGDKDCAGRGYDRESFASIDTSNATTFYTLTLIP